MTATPSAEPAHDIPEISREEILARRDDPDFILLDVLPPASYENGHIPGAVSLPVAEIPERAHQVLPDPEQDIAVYCAAFT